MWNRFPIHRHWELAFAQTHMRDLGHDRDRNRTVKIQPVEREEKIHVGHSITGWSIPGERWSVSHFSPAVTSWAYCLRLFKFMGYGLWWLIRWDLWCNIQAISCVCLRKWVFLAVFSFFLSFLKNNASVLQVYDFSFAGWLLIPLIFFCKCEYIFFSIFHVSFTLEPYVGFPVLSILQFLDFSH